MQADAFGAAIDHVLLTNPGSKKVQKLLLDKRRFQPIFNEIHIEQKQITLDFVMHTHTTRSYKCNTPSCCRSKDMYALNCWISAWRDAWFLALSFEFISLSLIWWGAAHCQLWVCECSVTTYCASVALCDCNCVKSCVKVSPSQSCHMSSIPWRWFCMRNLVYDFHVSGPPSAVKI